MLPLGTLLRGREATAIEAAEVVDRGEEEADHSMRVRTVEIGKQRINIVGDDVAAEVETEASLGERRDKSH